MAFCSTCGTNIGTNRFCTSCGAPQPTTTDAPRDSSGATDATRIRPTSEPTPPRQVPSVRPQAQPPVQGRVGPPVVGPAPVRQATIPPPLSPSGQALNPHRWTATWIALSTVFLTGLAACGFVVAYFFIPSGHGNDTIPPAAPQLAASTSQDDSAAPAAGTSERDAWDQLQRIAAQDRGALQSTQLWRAQLASSPATESSEDFLRTYRAMMQKMPNSLLAWSGDWPNSYAEGSRQSWVILSNFTKVGTSSIIDWCLQDNRRCWAKRLTTIGTPADNTDHPPADPSKN